MNQRRIVVSLAALAAILLISQAVFADPPATVGRLNLTTGTVSFMPGTLDTWSPAVPNYPLTAGDRLWTDNDGRAEIHVGSTALRLDANTEMAVLSLDEQTLQVSLTQGSLDVRLRQLDAGDTVEIDTSNSVVTLLTQGDYRIDSAGEGDVNVTVRSGLAEVESVDDVYDLGAPSLAHLTGTDSVFTDVFPAPAPDAWDAWCASRNAREDQVQSVRYVPREMIGVEDLDGNGAWMTVAGYGQVWYPTRVPAGWAPYHFGRWAWVEPWGWTWIDDAAWGFAPFHYGRWAFLQSRWVWIPGTIVARPVYAPALVVFVGGGNPDQVGWFPLGPQEVYVPPYQVSPAYVQRLNVTNVTNVTIQVIQNINVTQVVYANRTVNTAVTVVPRQSFLQSRPTSVSALPTGSFDVRRAPVVGMGAQIQPQRESIVGQQVNPQRPVPQPPQNVVSRRVFSRLTPAPVPQPFAPRDQAAPAPAGTQAPAQPPAQPQQRPVVAVTPLRPVPNPPTARTPPQQPQAQAPAPQAPAPRTPPAPAAQAPAPQAPAPQDAGRPDPCSPAD